MTCCSSVLVVQYMVKSHNPSNNEVSLIEFLLQTLKMIISASC